MIWNVSLISNKGYLLVTRPYKDIFPPFQPHLIGKFLLPTLQFEDAAFHVHIEEFRYSTFRILLLRTAEFELAGITGLNIDAITVNGGLARIAEELHYLYPNTFSTAKSLSSQLQRRIKLIIDYYLIRHQLISPPSRKGKLLPRADRESLLY